MTDDLNASLRSQVNEVLAATLSAEDRVREAVAAYHAQHGVDAPWAILGVTKYLTPSGDECYAVSQCMLVVGQGSEGQSLTYAAHCDLVVRQGDDFVVIEQCSDDEGETSF